MRGESGREGTNNVFCDLTFQFFEKRFVDGHDIFNI